MGTMRIKVALGAFAVLAVACGTGGSDRATDSQSVRSAPGHPVEPVQLTLIGCVQLGSATTEFILENVRVDHGPQPRAVANGPGGGIEIEEGSWVQLRSNETKPGQYIGREVRVTGKLVSTGESTIGTSGSRGVASLPSGDKSMAATSEHYWQKVKAEAGRSARESLANGTAPEIRPEKFEPTGRACGASEGHGH